MKVILLERVGRMGHIGDEVTVKDGFARNFLLPQQKALRATDANRKKFESERTNIETRNAERREAAAGIAEGLNGRSVMIIRQAGETGQLYGSVSSRDVAVPMLFESRRIGDATAMASVDRPTGPPPKSSQMAASTSRSTLSRPSSSTPNTDSPAEATSRSMRASASTSA